MGKTSQARDHLTDVLGMIGESQYLSALAEMPRGFLESYGELDLIAQLLPFMSDRRVGTSYPLDLPVLSLTPREATVLALLVKSASAQVIADGLFVTRNTVKTQLSGLYRKLEVTNRADAIAKATS